MPFTNNVSTERKGGYKSPVLAYQVHVGVHALLEAGMLLAACWWHLSSALTCSFAQLVWVAPLVQLTKHPVVQNVEILNEGSDDQDDLD